MNMFFEEGWGKKGSYHLAQFNIRVEPDCGIITLYEHEQSGFRVVFTIPEVEKARLWVW